MQQLIYVSAAVRPFRYVDLRDMLTKARKFNGSQAISGMMVYQARSVLQALEGPEDAVITLFERIRRDPRHTAIRLVSRTSISLKEFENWPMGLVDNLKEGPDVIGYGDYSAIQILGIDVARAKTVLTALQRGPWRRLADH